MCIQSYLHPSPHTHALIHRTATAVNSFTTAFSYPSTGALVSFMEHVIVTMTLTINLDPGQTRYYYNSSSHSNPGPKRGDIKVTLISPGGTTSVLLPLRPLDYINTEGYGEEAPWPFMSVHHWGETPFGAWSLTVAFVSSGATIAVSNLNLQVYGTTKTPEAVSRIPKSCDPSCARGCAATGPQYCDACLLYRVPSTLECISVCPNSTSPVDGYCVNGTVTPISAQSTGKIVGITVGSLGLVIIVALAAACLIYAYRRTSRRDYVPIRDQHIHVYS